MQEFTTGKPNAEGGSRTTHHRRAFAGTAALAVTAILALVSTSAGAAARPPAPQYPAVQGATSPVVVHSARHGALGSILVTAAGYTLYYDKSDTATKIACVGGCAAIWPPLVLPKGDRSARAGGDVAQSALGTVLRPGGARQVTYAGHPLYRYVGDASPGQAKGEGIGGFYVVKASARTRSTPAATAPSGRGY
jgi:predicted lipoprotein with Yx(FWY)xxD motif